jgi:flagellar P-ring protein FlgI
MSIAKKLTIAISLTVAVLATMPRVSTQGVTRVKDVTMVQGARSAPIIGYGLVAGLNRTGDRRQAVLSAQSLANILSRFGVTVPADQMRVENVAAVLVTAELPPFARPGTRVDVTVSSVGDARSLMGGTLLATPLRGADSTVQVLAQGPLSVGGFGAGQGINSVQVNHVTVGRVPGGGMVQAAPPVELLPGGRLTLTLREPDFDTARRLAGAVNGDLGPGSAEAIDAGSVSVAVPERFRATPVELIARLEMLPLDVDAPARVVINERTGTAVVGANVRLGAAAVAHGNLSVRISTELMVSQPNAFSRNGDTVVVPQTDVDVAEGRRQMVALPEGATLDAVVRALNSLGASPRDIIAILQALKTAGALRAEIVIM